MSDEDALMLEFTFRGDDDVRVHVAAPCLSAALQLANRSAELENRLRVNRYVTVRIPYKKPLHPHNMVCWQVLTSGLPYSAVDFAPTAYPGYHKDAVALRQAVPGIDPTPLVTAIPRTLRTKLEKQIHG